jgi:hypothetical protein
MKIKIGDLTFHSLKAFLIFVIEYEEQIEDMEQDIKKLIVALDSLTKKDTKGEEWLEEIKRKYSATATTEVRVKKDETKKK